MEIWKPIDNFPRYYVSNYGRLKSTPTQGSKGGIMKSTPGDRGRQCVSLRKEGKYHYRKVHRLVAEAFLPNPNNLPVVMHLDNDASNNHVSNLKWGTQKENIHQAIYEDRTHNWCGKRDTFPPPT